MALNEVIWTDVAPRDGLENIADTISTEAKIRLVRGPLDAGVPRVEATSFVSRVGSVLADAPAVLAGLQNDLPPAARADRNPPRPGAFRSRTAYVRAVSRLLRPTSSTGATSIERLT